MKKSERQKGFTLIELMIVISIIGILVGIAYPSYMNSVRKSNRTEAKTDLMDAAQRLQRCYTAYGKFNSTDCAAFMQLSSGAGITSQGRGFYRIQFAAVPTATAYTLQATAIKAPQLTDTGCVTMTLTSVGVKTPAAPATCW